MEMPIGVETNIHIFMSHPSVYHKAPITDEALSTR